MFSGIIYKATNQINKKSYIGSTIRTLNERKSEHLTTSKYDKTKLFYSDILKYGKGKFKWEIVYQCDSEDDMIQKEKDFIIFYYSYGENGYNMTRGGRGKKSKGELFKIRTILILENNKKIVINNYRIESELVIDSKLNIKWIKTHKFYKKIQN